jgi:uncharacterized damage-inducible protein DinB
MKRVISAAALLLVVAANAQAQEKASGMNMSVMGITSVYNMAKGNILKTAEQVPQEMYSFKPTPEVRSMGAILGHIADAQHMFCTVAEGKEPPAESAGGAEKLTDKAAIIAALKASFAHCDAVMAKTTDADLMTPHKLFGMDMNTAAILTLNASHDYEHYGNLVTYMRLNKMVPPSSQGQ